ncbi:MAG: rmlD [Gammaproteobacteria bacterium]|nr:rmlD [Gammaproteobacteria bacterium]
MKALITGVGGQVGRSLASTAPTSVNLLATSHKELDIADGRAVVEYVRAHSPDVIINAAAYTAVDRAESEPELAKRINSDGARHLAAAARETGARLIHISTDFVFDGATSTPYRPNAATNPLSVYGATKLAGEKAVLEALPENSVVVRTAWVYAAAGSNFVRTMLRVMNANGSVRVVADQVGTPTAAGALAEALWGVVAKSEIKGVHHWTDAGVASWYDFAVAIAEEGAQLGLVSDGVTVTPIATADYPTPARRPSYSVLDKTSLTSFGLVPLHWRKRLRGILGEMKIG